MSIKHSQKFSFRLEKYNNNYSVYNYKKISQFLKILKFPVRVEFGSYFTL